MIHAVAGDGVVSLEPSAVACQALPLFDRLISGYIDQGLPGLILLSLAGCLTIVTVMIGAPRLALAWRAARAGVTPREAELIEEVEALKRQVADLKHIQRVLSDREHERQRGLAVIFDRAEETLGAGAAEWLDVVRAIVLEPLPKFDAV